jgi:hypothetical protein
VKKKAIAPCCEEKSDRSLLWRKKRSPLTVKKTAIAPYCEEKSDRPLLWRKTRSLLRKSIGWAMPTLL